MFLIQLEGDKMSLEIINSYPKEKRYTLAILQDIQREHGYIPKEYMEYTSEYLNLPLSDVYSIATFYKSLSLKPKGKYVIKVCNGTACHIRDSISILKELQDILGIESGETTEDGLFSLEIVNCIGACALAPVMLINNKYYGAMTKEKVKTVIEDLQGVSANV